MAIDLKITWSWGLISIPLYDPETKSRSSPKSKRNQFGKPTARSHLNEQHHSEQPGGLRIAGESNAPGDQVAAVPFARVINNTVVGAGEYGVLVEDNASPTLLNNLIAGFDTGIDIDTTSSTTVIGGTLYASTR